MFLLNECALIVFFLVIHYGHFKTILKALALTVYFWRPSEKFWSRISLYKNWSRRFLSFRSQFWIASQIQIFEARVLKLCKAGQVFLYILVDGDKEKSKNQYGKGFTKPWLYKNYNKYCSIYIHAVIQKIKGYFYRRT
jgi:hypothetical protein